MGRFNEVPISPDTPSAPRIAHKAPPQAPDRAFMPPDAAQWLDAQALLRRLCSGLAVGQLLHGPSFSLSDSTVAIEIGDPKMDIGLQRDRETRSAEELIARGGAPVALPPPLLLAAMDRLLCLEATWHTGSMLPQTVFTSLHMLHTDRLAPNAPLHAFCLAVKSTCTVFVDMVHAAAVTEDEDFFVHTFGIRMLDLPGGKPVAAALQALAAAEEQLEHRAVGSGGDTRGGSKAAAAPAPPPSPPQPQQLQQGGEQAGASAPCEGGDCSKPGAAEAEWAAVAAVQEPSPDQAAALLARIRFRLLLLEALQSLQLYSRAGVEAAARQCQLALAQLALVEGSAGLAAPLEQAPGFVPEVNRQHMGLVPPRPVHARSFEQAMAHWRGLLAALSGALQALLGVGSWPELRAALVRFAAGSHHAIVRSALHLQLIKPLPPPPPPAPTPTAPALADPPSTGCAAATEQPIGVSGVGGPPGDGCKAASGPGGGGKAAGSPRGGGKVASSPGGRGKAISSPVSRVLPAGSGGAGGGVVRKPARELPLWCPGQEMVCRELGVALASVPSPDAALFVEQAAIAVQGDVYALCLNRCRQRRRLRRQLEDWRNIFDHGFNADVTPDMQGWLVRAGWRWGAAEEGMLQGQGPAATWAEREAAACALLHLQLGFCLDLYAPHEYLQIYWYSDYLLECQHRRGLALHRAAPAPPPSPKRGLPAGGAGRGGKPRGGRPGGGGGPAGQAGGAAGAAATRELELLLVEVERHMCQGMFRAAIALQQMGCIAVPATPFNLDEQRYEQRFGCLEQLCRPEPLPFAHFRSATDPGDLPPARVLAAALASFQRAAQCASGLLAAPPLRARLREEQVRHLETVQRIATQNAVAAKLLAAACAGEAAAGSGGGQGAAAPPHFKVQFDFKAALAASTAQFYPAILLKH